MGCDVSDGLEQTCSTVRSNHPEGARAFREAYVGAESSAAVMPVPSFTSSDEFSSNSKSA